LLEILVNGSDGEDFLEIKLQGYPLHTCRKNRMNQLLIFSKLYESYFQKIPENKFKYFYRMNFNTLLVDLKEIQNSVLLPQYIIDVIHNISNEKITSAEVDKICLTANVNYSIAKVGFLHFIFEYIQIALKDDILTTEEKEVISYFKKLFKIHPGDFTFHTNDQVENVINYQLTKMYSDNYITPEEALLKSELQELFDLSFDQMNEYSKLEAKVSMKQGAAVENLDVVFTHKEYFEIKNNLDSTPSNGNFTD
jgi:hypothetical protein